MTGGHYGVMMLLTGTKPVEFVDVVAYITLGKWLGVGMVLAHESQQVIMRGKISGMPSRGMSTYLVCEEAFALWQMAISNLPLTNKRHATVLNKLKLKKEESWGGQLHIFGPVRRYGMTASTKNRFLPQLDDTPIDSNLQVRKEPEWDRMKINKKITSQVELWIMDEVIAYARSPVDYHIMKVIKHYVQHRRMADWWFDFKYIQSKLLHTSEEERNLARGDITHIIGTLIRSDMITYIQKYGSRRRVYEGKCIMKMPWTNDVFLPTRPPIEDPSSIVLHRRVSLPMSN